MYAVVKAGGKQYRVAIGDVIRVERLPAQPGESINLHEVLLIKDNDDVHIGTPLLSEPVTATVRGHGRGDKIRVFKMRRRKNSRRRTGHRQEYTELEVTSIGGAGKARATQKKVAKETEEDKQPTAEPAAAE